MTYKEKRKKIIYEKASNQQFNEIRIWSTGIHECEWVWRKSNFIALHIYKKEKKKKDDEKQSNNDLSTTATTKRCHFQAMQIFPLQKNLMQSALFIAFNHFHWHSRFLLHSPSLSNDCVRMSMCVGWQWASGWGREETRS